jgi:hypothetical protein
VQPVFSRGEEKILQETKVMSQENMESAYQHCLHFLKTDRKSRALILMHMDSREKNLYC